MAKAAGGRKTKPVLLLEPSDVGRRLEPPLAATSVKVHADAGRLRLAAITPRGTRLFHPDDVAAFQRTRGGVKGESS